MGSLKRIDSLHSLKKSSFLRIDSLYSLKRVALKESISSTPLKESFQKNRTHLKIVTLKEPIRCTYLKRVA